jgi:copper chaperone
MIQIIWQLLVEVQTSTHAEMKPFYQAPSEKELLMSVAMEIQVENLKCGGCARSILKGLTDMQGVSNVEVDHENKLVKFSGEEVSRPQVAEKLRSMGYPEKGTLEGLSAGVANAKSFVSCAFGRVS